VRSILLPTLVAATPFTLALAALGPHLVEAKKSTLAQRARSALVTLHAAQRLYRQRSMATRDLERALPLRTWHSTSARVELLLEAGSPSPGSYSLVNAYLTRGEPPPPEVQFTAVLDHASLTQQQLRYTYARSLEELGRRSLIDGLVASGNAYGYSFELHTSSNQPHRQWVAVANPQRNAGPWSFAIDSRGELYAAHRLRLEPEGDALMPAVARPWATLRAQHQ